MANDPDRPFELSMLIYIKSAVVHIADNLILNASKYKTCRISKFFENSIYFDDQLEIRDSRNACFKTGFKVQYINNGSIEVTLSGIRTGYSYSTAFHPNSHLRVITTNPWSHNDINLI